MRDVLPDDAGPGLCDETLDLVHAVGVAGDRCCGPTPTVTAAITSIPDTAWVPIRYPNAI